MGLQLKTWEFTPSPVTAIILALTLTSSGCFREDPQTMNKPDSTPLLIDRSINTANRATGLLQL